MTAPLHGVLFGLGHMGTHHARKLQARPDVRLQVLDPPRGLSGDVGRPDFAVVAVPTTAHLQVARDLLEAGVPCLVEKPLAATVDDAAALAAHPGCCPGHIERFNPVFRAMGPVDARFVQAERVAPPTGRSRDVDVVTDLMIHDLDLAAVLLGEPITEVRAIGVALSRTPGAPVDLADARLETASGRVATLTASRAARRSVRSLRVFTSGEYWSLDLAGGRAECIPWGESVGVARIVPLPPGDALDAEHEAFLAFARKEAPFPVSAAEGLRAMVLASAVHARIRAAERPV